MLSSYCSVIARILETDDEIVDKGSWDAAAQRFGVRSGDDNWHNRERGGKSVHHKFGHSSQVSSVKTVR